MKLKGKLLRPNPDSLSIRLREDLLRTTRISINFNMPKLTDPGIAILKMLYWNKDLILCPLLPAYLQPAI